MTASTEPQPDGIDLEEVRILRLQPGDTIVLTADHHVTQQEADDIRQKLMSRFPGHEAIVIGPGLELSVAREEVS